MDIRRYLANHLGAAIGVALCAAAAWAATLFKWQTSRQLIPVIFLVIVLVLGAWFGRTVGILGSIIGALVFARALYRPPGIVHISDPGARASVAWMLLAGVTLSYLLLPSQGDRSPRG